MKIKCHVRIKVILRLYNVTSVQNAWFYTCLFRCALVPTYPYDILILFGILGKRASDIVFKNIISQQQHLYRVHIHSHVSKTSFRTIYQAFVNRACWYVFQMYVIAMMLCFSITEFSDAILCWHHYRHSNALLQHHYRY